MTDGGRRRYIYVVGLVGVEFIIWALHVGHIHLVVGIDQGWSENECCAKKVHEMLRIDG